MRVRAHRIRRAGAAVALGIGMVGGVIGVAAGTSGAVTPTKGDTITAASAPTVPSTGSGHAAGNLTVTLGVKTGATSTSTVVLQARAANGTTGFVGWTSVSVSSTGVTLEGWTYTANTTELEITLPPLATGAKATLNVKGITYKTETARGTVTVTPYWTTDIANRVDGTFNPTSAVNAVAPGAPASIPGGRTLTATSTPSVGAGATSAVGGWDLSLRGTTAEGWTAGETVTVEVLDPTGTNCATPGDYVLFTGTPTATVTASTKVSATPTFSVSSYGDGTCVVNDHNVLTLTFTNSGTFTGTGSFTVTVSGVKYAIGATTPTGYVFVIAAFDGGTTGFTNPATAVDTQSSQNARIALVYVTANTPPVTVPADAYDAPISPIDVVETAPDSVSPGYVCVELTSTAGNRFNTSAPAMAKVTKGTAAVTAKVTYERTTGAAATTTATASYARFKITKPSATTASTFSLSGVAINTTWDGTAPTAYAWEVASNETCELEHALVTFGGATAYNIGARTTRIGGATADATAVKQLETVFDANGGNGSCPGTGTSAKNTRPVVLATTATYQDALASSYLAGYLDTGTLLTPTGQLSSVTLQALKTEGITQVYVVGGPLAISTAVVDTLMTTPAYQCGGTGVLKTGGNTRYLQVTRIWGQTQYDTAQKIAQSVPASWIDTYRVPGAYAGVNAAGGNGKYNDTAGSASTAPATGAYQKTAFLASGVEFQDAMAASGRAYETQIPVLLTSPTALSSQAEAAISNLTITQVVVLGGPLAINDTVVKTLEGLGVSVLRVAGQNYTDTSVQLAEFMMGSYSTAGLGYHLDFTTSTGYVAVARGNGFTDGIAGAVLTARFTLPLLLTLNQTTVGTHLTAFLVSAGQSGTGIDGTGTSVIYHLLIFGGPKAITQTVVAKMQTDIS